MSKANCKDCTNRINRRFEDVQDYSGNCAFHMRFASTAGGSEPDDLRDVYFCRDYDSEEYAEYEGDEEYL